MTVFAPDLQRAARDPAVLPTWLGVCFLVATSFPTLVDLPGDVTPGHLLMMACLPVWAVAFLDRGALPFETRGTVLAMIVLACSGFVILLALLSALVAEFPHRVMRPVVSFGTAFAMFLLVSGTITPRRIRLFLDTACISMVSTCILTSAAYFDPTLNQMIFGNADRASGFFKNPNQYGIAISSIFPISVTLSLVSRRKTAWISGSFFLMLGLVASGSKTNLLISALSLLGILVLFCMIRYHGRTRIWMLLITLTGYAAVTMIGVLSLSLLNPRALTLLQSFFKFGTTHSLESREDLWSRSMELFLENPALGVGAGQPIFSHVSHSHNVIIDFSRTLGVPGLLLILVVLTTIVVLCLQTIISALRSPRSDLSVRCLCIGTSFGPLAYVAANFSSDSFGPTTSPFLYAIVFLNLACRPLLSATPRRGSRGLLA